MPAANSTLKKIVNEVRTLDPAIRNRGDLMCYTFVIEDADYLILVLKHPELERLFVAEDVIPPEPDL